MKNMILLTICVLTGCSASSEAPRVDRAVVPDDTGLVAVTNDLGWQVTVSTARVSLTNLVFTTKGEAHASSLWTRALDALVPNVTAHPGHLAGGEAIGELPGSHVVDFASDEPLGTATLIVGRYDGANFTFASSDELGGASIELGGTASREGAEVTWTASITQDSTRVVVGLPMDVEVDETQSGSLGFQLLTVDPTDESNVLFDAVDFGEAPELEITPESDAGVRLLRASQRHDFWRVVQR